MQGVPPATVAEFTLQASGNQDFYDGESSMSLEPTAIADDGHYTQYLSWTDTTFQSE